MFKNIDSTPVKSALSQFRKGISFLFIKEKHTSIVQNFIPLMKKHKDYHLIAIDGDQFDLPASKDILSKGYRGFPVREKRETYYPRMYTTRAVDLLSGVVINFKEAVNNDEISQAVLMLSSIPQKSIVFYDRLYLCEKLIKAHAKSGQQFIARCKGGSTFKEIKDFYKSNKRRDYFYIEDEKINLVKIINPRSKEAIVLATTLNLKNWKNKDIARLYTLRWDIETSNRDSTVTMGLEQWRSKSYNGIMQEIFAHLILMNLTKIIIFTENGYKIDLEENTTEKSNFKLILSHFIDHFYDLIQGRINKILQKLRPYIDKSTEKRKRLKRSYERKIKKSHRRYNIVFTKRRA